jgi:hypothetical protein
MMHVKIIAPQDPGNATFDDDETPFLEFSTHPRHGDGWTLWYLDANGDPDDHFIAGEITDGGRALSEARDWLRRVREAGA